MGRLHRLVDDGAEIGAELVEVDLVAETLAECVEGLFGVVAAAVEAAVDEGLDSSSGGAEEGGDGEGGAGDCEVVAAG